MYDRCLRAGNQFDTPSARIRMTVGIRVHNSRPAIALPRFPAHNATQRHATRRHPPFCSPLLTMTPSHTRGCPCFTRSEFDSTPEAAHSVLRQCSAREVVSDRTGRRALWPALAWRLVRVTALIGCEPADSTRDSCEATPRPSSNGRGPHDDAAPTAATTSYTAS